MYKKVLVPISPTAKQQKGNHAALERARKICDGELVLLYVSEPVAQTIGGTGRLEVESEIKSDALHLLEPYIQELEKADVPFHTRIVPGTVAEVIVQTAANENADLIVMYTDGREDFADLFLGTITERVLRDTSTDLLAIRE